jgi:uncharacterized protein with HEPN domain
MNEAVSWSKLFEYRDKMYSRYPEIWNPRILWKRFNTIMIATGLGNIISGLIL